MSWGEFAQILTAIAALGGLAISWRNGRKIEAVHQSTNGMSERNEQIARKLGVEEGKAEEKASSS